MADADRLREAADRLDDWTDEVWLRKKPTAALLRAVADGHNEACFTPEGECPEGLAALALAATILGSE